MPINLSRRKFIKLSSISAVAIGSGYTAGKLFGNSENQLYSVYCFLPSYEILITEVIRVFSATVKINSTPIIIADDDYYYN